MASAVHSVTKGLHRGRLAPSVDQRCSALPVTSAIRDCEYSPRAVLGRHEWTKDTTQASLSHACCDIYRRRFFVADADATVSSPSADTLASAPSADVCDDILFFFFERFLLPWS